MNYWSTVPIGFWRITDHVDALNALRDRESFVEYDPVNNRIHILGTFHKAVILDIHEILTNIGDDREARKVFLTNVKQILRLNILEN